MFIFFHSKIFPLFPFRNNYDNTSPRFDIFPAKILWVSTEIPLSAQSFLNLSRHPLLFGFMLAISTILWYHSFLLAHLLLSNNRSTGGKYFYPYRHICPGVPNLVLTHSSSKCWLKNWMNGRSIWKEREVQTKQKLPGAAWWKRWWWSFGLMLSLAL